MDLVCDMMLQFDSDLVQSLYMDRGEPDNCRWPLNTIQVFRGHLVTLWAAYARKYTRSGPGAKAGFDIQVTD
jgi:hypothetical protein